MVDTIKFSQMPNAGNINNNDIMPSLRSGENVILNNPWTFLPSGSTADRPTPSSEINYRLRFNTTDQLYEYYDAVLGVWTQLQESAFTQGPFVIYTADPSIPDGQNLGALANGILKQTITLGVATIDIAVNGVDYYGPGYTGYINAPAGIADINSNPIINTVSVGASAVNYVRIQNSITGNSVAVSAQGLDSNIPMTLSAKGTSPIGLVTGAPTQPILIYSGTGNQHLTRFNMSDTAADRQATWQDSDGTVAWLSDVLATVTSAEGTENQVLVNGNFGTQETGACVFSTPQDIATTSTPIFAGFNNLDATPLIQLYTSTASSVNYLGISAAPTGQPVELFALGSDTDIGFNFNCKNAGTFYIYTLGSTAIQFSTGTGYQHKTNFVFPTTSAIRTATWQDSDGTVAWTSDLSGFISTIQGNSGTATPIANTVTIDGGATGLTTLGSGSTLSLTGTLGVANGGTGQSSLTTYTLLAGGTTSTGALQQVSAGTLGQLLQSNGAGALPSWVDLSSVGVTSITGTANQVFANATSATPQVGAVTLTLPQDIATSSNVQFGGIMSGSATGSQGASAAGTINAVGLSTSGNFIASSYINTAGSAPTFWAYKSRSTSVGSFTTVQAADTIGRHLFFADDGTQFKQVAGIVVQAEGTISTGIVPGVMTISTANASGVVSTALTIDSSQKVTAQAAFFGNTTIQANAGLISGKVAGGTAGSTTLYSPTASLGNFQQVAIDNAGNYSNVLTHAATSAARTWTLPDATGTIALTGSASSGYVLLAPSGLQTITGFDLTINTVRVGLGNGSVSSNVTVGGLAGSTSGAFNTAVGYASMAAIGAGGSNTALGATAMFNTGACSENTAVGYNAMYGGTTTGNYNTAVGSQALQGTSFAGEQNTAIGRATLQVATSANNNSALGFNALLGVTTGDNNTSAGASCGNGITTGTSNTLMGFVAGTDTAAGAAILTTGNFNTFIGAQTSGNTASIGGGIAIGYASVALASTGGTSSDNGVGISIGSAAVPVGFRGDGSIYPGFMGAGNWRVVVNGTAYKLPMLADGATSLGALSATQISFTTTSGIIGTTTNDNAAAGSVGEFVSSEVAGVSINTNTVTNVTSISLTAGDWDVWANLSTEPAAGTLCTGFYGWISTSSATFPANNTNGGAYVQNPGISPPAANPWGVFIGQRRLSLSGTTTVYLTGYLNFSVSTMGIAGFIGARRVR